MAWSISHAMLAAYENSHCSQELEEESSEGTCSDGIASAELNTTPTPDQYYWPDKTTEHSRLSRFGMTCVPLTEDHGEAVLTWFLAGFPAKPTPPLLLESQLLTISGRKCSGSWQMSLPGTYLPRMSAEKQSKTPLEIASRLAIKPDLFPYPRQTWVVTTFGKDIGYLHTPTCTANYAAPSMQKHPCAREFVRVFGNPSPSNHEWMMGWPAGMSGLKPLGTGKFRLWQRQHGIYSNHD